MRVYRHDRLHSFADLVEVNEYSEEFRGGEGDRRKFPSQGCKYFGEWCVDYFCQSKVSSLTEYD